MSDDPRSQPEPAPGAMLELARGITAPGGAIRIQYSRSSGPGGQNVNKVNTRVQLWIPVGAILGLSERAAARLRKLAGSRLTAAGELNLTAETERTQEGNRQAVMERLRLLLEEAMREPRPRKKTRPSRAARARRLTTKRRRGEVKSRRRFRGPEE